MEGRKRLLLISAWQGVMVGLLAAQTPIPEIASRCSPSVLRIDVFGELNILEPESWREPIATATAFAMAPDVVLTNWHVAAMARECQLQSQNGRSLGVAGVVASDRSKDQVLLRVYAEDGAEPDLPPLLRSSTVPSVGDQVVVIGYPLGLDTVVSDGIVSSMSSNPDGSGVRIQVTASISPGSSGSPVVGPDGSVIGVITSSMIDGQNINFAAPIVLEPKVGSSFPAPLQHWSLGEVTEQEEGHARSEFNRIKGTLVRELKSYAELGQVDYELLAPRHIDEVIALLEDHPDMPGPRIEFRKNTLRAQKVLTVVEDPIHNAGFRLPDPVLDSLRRECQAAIRSDPHSLPLRRMLVALCPRETMGFEGPSGVRRRTVTLASYLVSLQGNGDDWVSRFLLARLATSSVESYTIVMPNDLPVLTGFAGEVERELSGADVGVSKPAWTDDSISARGATAVLLLQGLEESGHQLRAFPDVSKVRSFGYYCRGQELSGAFEGQLHGITPDLTSARAQYQESLRHIMEFEEQVQDRDKKTGYTINTTWWYPSEHHARVLQALGRHSDEAFVWVEKSELYPQLPDGDSTWFPFMKLVSFRINAAQAFVRAGDRENALAQTSLIKGLMKRADTELPKDQKAEAGYRDARALRENQLQDVLASIEDMKY